MARITKLRENIQSKLASYDNLDGILQGNIDEYLESTFTKTAEDLDKCLTKDVTHWTEEVENSYVKA